MTLPDEDTIVIRGKPLLERAPARCASCGKSGGLGRIMSPGFEWGVVFCPEHAERWLDVLIGALTHDEVTFERILRAAGLR